MTEDQWEPVRVTVGQHPYCTTVWQCYQLVHFAPCCGTRQLEGNRSVSQLVTRVGDSAALRRPDDGDRCVLGARCGARLPLRTLRPCARRPWHAELLAEFRLWSLACPPMSGGLAATADPWVRWDWVSRHTHTIAAALRQHVVLTGVSVAVGLLVSIPLGVIAWRWHRWQQPLFAVAG